MKWDNIKEELLKDLKFQKAYKEQELSFEVAKQIMKARLKKNLTQASLAKRIGTKQSSIARAESGDVLPSLSFLARIAKALKIELIAPKFKFLEQRISNDVINHWDNSLGLHTINEHLLVKKNNTQDQKEIIYV
jgi:ribosome-binding protein aMBF1 (putative translation factor)